MDNEIIKLCKIVIRQAKRKNLMCSESSCPCVKDSYNDCSYDWQFSYALNELNNKLKEGD